MTAQSPLAVTPPSPLAVTPGLALILAGLLDANHPIDAAEKTAIMQMRRGNYPFPICALTGTKRRYVIRIADIDAALAQKAATGPIEATSAVTEPKRRRGRPRKVSRASQLDP